MDDVEQIESVLSRIDSVVSDDLSTEEKTAEILDIGVRAFDVDFGYLTKIDPERDHWQVIVSTDDLDTDVPVGREEDFHRTFCQNTVEEGRITVTDATREGWTDDPACETCGLETYLGVSVQSATPMIGTVCFGSREPRGEPFSGDELLLAELLGRTIEAERYRSRTADELDHLYEFVSMISHDLRNPLTVASGWVEAEQVSQESDGLDRALTALRRMESLIEHSVRLARGAQPVTDLEPISLLEISESCWRAVRTGSTALDLTGDLCFVANPDRIRWMFVHLFRNAVEHADESATVRVGPLENGRGFFVEDDGEGITNEVRERMFEPGFSTTDAGEGLGLPIVETIATAHDWELRVASGADGGARFEVRDVVLADKPESH